LNSPRSVDAEGDEVIIADNTPRPAPRPPHWLASQPASLLDAYFEPPPSDDVAVLAGAIADVAATETAAARHTAARGHLSQNRRAQPRRRAVCADRELRRPVARVRARSAAPQPR
jgi:hypothetical protein